MRRTWTLEQRSIVAAPAHQVWDRVVTPEGINDEMRPWMTMAVPRGAADVTIDTLEIGRPIGRAWLRLFGVVPFDADDLMIVLVEHGRRFREESSMLSMRSWVHDRTVEPADDGTTQISDVVTFTPRVGLRPAGPLLLRILRAFFAHRHRRLARHFG